MDGWIVLGGSAIDVTPEPRRFLDLNREAPQADDERLSLDLGRCDVGHGESCKEDQPEVDTRHDGTLQSPPCVPVAVPT